MNTPRMCQRFHCDARGDRYCCTDCPQRGICANPCLNHPLRCGLEDKGARIRMQEVSKINREQKRRK